MKHLKYLLIATLLTILLLTGYAIAEETYVVKKNLGNLYVNETQYFHAFDGMEIWWPSDRGDEPYIDYPSLDWGDDDIFYYIHSSDYDVYLQETNVYHNGTYCDRYIVFFDVWIGVTVRDGAYTGKSERHFIMRISDYIDMEGGSSDQYDYWLNYTIVPYPDAYLLTSTAVYRVGSDGKNLTYLYPNVIKSKHVIPDYVALAGTKYPVIRIGKQAFNGDTDVTLVTIGKNVKFIESYAFRNCTNLTKVTGGTGLVKIGPGAFKGCTDLSSFVLKSTKLTSIGNQAFYNCRSLNSIVIPQNVTSIGKQAFYNCRSLATITIKSKLLKASGFGLKAFGGPVDWWRTWKVPASKKTAYRNWLIRTHATDVY